MNIYARPGSRVIFTGRGGYDTERLEAQHILGIAEIYTVNYTEVHSSYTYVYLEGYDRGFNSVMFEDWET